MSAKPPSEQYASCSAAPGMPSEEEIARAIAQADEQNGALPYEARMAMGKHVREALFDQASAVLSLIRPAFEAKTQECQTICDSYAGENQRLHDRALSAEATIRELRMQALSDEGQMRELQAKLAQAVEALESATAFDLGDEIVVESRGKGMWAVKNFSSVLNADGVWEWEPRPSGRDDAFISRTRFSRDEAFQRARSASAAGRGETSALACVKETP